MMNLTTEVFAFTLTVLALATAFTITGYAFFRRTGAREKDPLAFELASGFFIGSAVFLAVWRLTAMVIGRADWSVYFALLVLVAASTLTLFKGNLRRKFRRLQRREVGGVAAAFLVIPTFVLVYWLEEGAGPIFNWCHVGSCHAARYANIAIQVFRENRIPVYGQDYEQSLLASVPSFLGSSHPTLGLYLWLSLSIIALVGVAYGIFRRFGFSERGALGGTLLLVAGNSSLSLVLVEVIDNGYPLLFSGKVDLVRSAGTFFVFLAWLDRVYRREAYSRGWGLFLLAVLATSWTMSAIQNIFLAVVLGAGVLWSLRRQRGAIFKEVAWGIIVVVITAAILSQHGGMLTRVQNRDTKEVPGVINYVKFPAKQELQINPTVPFSALGAFWTDHLPKAMPFTLSQLLRLGSFTDLLKIVFAIEQNLWSGVKTVFFPLLGFVGLGLLLRKRKKTPEVREVWIAGVLLFAVGFPINTLVDVNWWRWGLTRFMIPGYCLGMICLILAAREIFSGLSRRAERRAWIALYLILLLGPSLGFLVKAKRNVHDVAQFQRNARALATFDDYVN